MVSGSWSRTADCPTGSRIRKGPRRLASNLSEGRVVLTLRRKSQTRSPGEKSGTEDRFFVGVKSVLFDGVLNVASSEFVDFFELGKALVGGRDSRLLKSD